MNPKYYKLISTFYYLSTTKYLSIFKHTKDTENDVMNYLFLLFTKISTIWKLGNKNAVYCLQIKKNIFVNQIECCYQIYRFY